MQGLHRSPVNWLHKGQWCGALMFSLICDWLNGWVNNREAGDLRHYRAHYDVTVMVQFTSNRSSAGTNITRASWHLKSPATWLFVWQLVQADNKGSTKEPHYWPWVTGGFLSQKESIHMSWCHHGTHKIHHKHQLLGVYCKYCKISNISHTKSQKLNDSRLILQLSLPNLLKPGVK